MQEEEQRVKRSSELTSIVDLTYPIKEGMPTFDCTWHPRVEVSQLGRIGFEGRESRKIVLGSHTGTHTDAPLHFLAGGKSVDEIGLQDLIGPVRILDVSFLQEHEALTVDHLIELGTLERRIILKFGWGIHWDSQKYYKDYPYLSLPAAEHLVNNGVRLLGIDTPSPDDGRTDVTGALRGTEQDSPVHKLLLRNGLVLVEYLANLNTVHEYDHWSLAVMPLLLVGSDGAPARVCLFAQ